ncbi:MAG: Ca-activated chloride channel family protein [Oleispira sp.]|jgi:Ca-activated chloride channel family protein
MELFFSQFHLLRPLWLLLLIPALVLFVLLLKRRLASARWHGIIDESLMPHVLDQMPSEQSRWPLWFILLAWIFTSIALSGPAWEQLPQPVQKKDDALVIVLDMSLSMAAQDVSPDRATRARQKVIDILKQRNEGLTALVVYAGDAYTVTPLTDDADTIINLVPALSPFIMPAMGSRPDKAFELADKLIHAAGLTKANFLLMTDGIQTKDIDRIEKVLSDTKHQLSILTLGTEEGAPIAMQEGGFKRDNKGNIVLPKLELDPIRELTSRLNSRWHQMSFDDTDWHYLLNINSLTDKALQTDANKKGWIDNNSLQEKNSLERRFDLWADQGYWLIFIIIFIATFSFRRGWLLSLVFLITLQPETSYASLWDDAWQTKDQQAQKVFTQDPAKAAELFEDPNWKASSLYRAEEYEKAAESFNIDTATGHFNRGNALAHAGKLEEAIKAYEQSLELNNDLADAEFNKALVEKLLQQQEQQKSDEQQESDEKQDSDEQQDSDQKQDSGKDKSDQEKSDDKNSDSQDSDQQNSEEKSSEEKDSDEQNTEEKKAKEKETEKSEADKKAEQERKEQAEKDTQATQSEAENKPSREEKQALEQWLNRIPDDPGGLLKRKFLYQYKQRDHQDEGEVSW